MSRSKHVRAASSYARFLPNYPRSGLSRRHCLRIVSEASSNKTISPNIFNWSDRSGYLPP